MNNNKDSEKQSNTQPSHGELFRGYLKSGLIKSATKIGDISQTSTPYTPKDAASQIGRSILAGIKDYGKSAYHLGMGLTDEANKQFTNLGQNLPVMNINKAIAEGRAKTAQSEQSKSVSAGKSSNKGIECYQNKTAQSDQPKSVAAGKSSNKGITNFQSKTSGTSRSQSSSASKGSSSGSSRGSGGGKSGGSSCGSLSGGQSK